MQDAIIAYLLTPAVLFGVIAFIVKIWIDFVRDARNERIKNEIMIKNKAELIAELISEWINHSNDNARLNRLSFEAFLWLPADIAKELSKTLCYKQGAKDINCILLMVRHYLLGHDDLEQADIVHFSPETQQ